MQTQQFFSELFFTSLFDGRKPVIPVLEIQKPEQAVPLAEALAAGGVSVIEITLRTPAALAAIAAVRSHCPQVTVGVGSVRTPAEMRSARSAGAAFAVSPGCTEQLAHTALALDFPYLAGAMTPSEMLALLELGFGFLKLFPAQVAGGIAMLKAVGGPIPQLRFCPTGGIDQNSYLSFLQLKNVFCVGGSWMVPRDAVEAGDWARITALATAIQPSV
ncbi:MAG TPA: bifunctional 4-hydroxy-2-oxoglutarate aldolase/2-dehydro-3-deoxy-phosphogluconate aldolase [Pseudomonadales bacterium]|nr:bifunctional 4-hydroxy-2-oxoglutarate aldolase/2-dehydro-3-deoxy-phosphogluconate aldolase [Pseudomonadales bacterium]